MSTEAQEPRLARQQGMQQDDRAPRELGLEDAALVVGRPVVQAAVDQPGVDLHAVVGLDAAVDGDLAVLDEVIAAAGADFHELSRPASGHDQQLGLLLCLGLAAGACRHEENRNRAFDPRNPFHLELPGPRAFLAASMSSVRRDGANRRVGPHEKPYRHFGPAGATQSERWAAMDPRTRYQQ
jgi:hypothetical protein